jgi:hypothetical protein
MVEHNGQAPYEVSPIPRASKRLNPDQDNDKERTCKWQRTTHPDSTPAAVVDLRDDDCEFKEPVVNSEVEASPTANTEHSNVDQVQSDYSNEAMIAEALTRLGAT